MRASITIAFFLTTIMVSCQKVPVTGRKQLNLVPNALIQSMALVEYDSFLTVSQVLPASNFQTQMLRTVDICIQQAVETYMKENGLSKMLKNYLFYRNPYLWSDEFFLYVVSLNRVAGKIKIPFYNKTSLS